MSNQATHGLDDDFKTTPDGKFLVWAHDMYEYEREAQAEGRALRARDERFYDGHQFSDEEKQVYAERNQKPRTYNEIKPAVDWIIGSERRARSDWNVLPRTADDVEPAQLKTKLIKYVDDINKAKWQRSTAFEDCVKTGEGWTRISVEPNEDGELMIQLNYENWQNILIDGQSVKADLSDNRYLWNTKIIDIETLEQWFPAKKVEIEADAGEYQELDDDLMFDQVGDDGNNLYNNSRRTSSGCSDANINVVRSGSMSIMGGHYSSTRRAVRVWEMWYRKTERVELLANAGGLTGQIFNSKNEKHVLALEEGAKKRETVREQMYMAIYTATTVLFHGKSIYKHNRYPFVRRLAFIDKTTKSPYGVIRQIVDPQSDLNQRKNQALFMMATRQVVADEGAVEDKDDAIKQVAKVNGYIEVKKGARFEIRDNQSLAGPHVQFAEMDSAYLKQISGVTSENRGMGNSALSGIAIQSLQEQGTVITTPIIDNHQLAHQLEGELILSLCEQYINRKMQFRVTSDIKNPGEKDFVVLNETPETDITATQADFVISERDYRQTMRQALSEQLMNVSAQMTQATGDPSLSIAFIEMAIDLQDLPNKERLSSKLREISGLPPIDENEDAKKAREEADQQQQAKQQAMQEALQELEMAKQKSAINLDNSRANQYNREGEREKANARRAQAEALVKYLEAAGLVVDNADLSNIADDLISNMDNIMNGTQPTQANSGQLEAQGQPVEQAPVPMQTDMPAQQEQPMPTQQQPVMPEGEAPAGEDEQPPMSDEEAAMMEQVMGQQSGAPDA